MEKERLFFYRNKAKKNAHYKVLIIYAVFLLFTVFLMWAMMYRYTKSSFIGIGVGLCTVFLLKFKILNPIKTFILGCLLSILTHFIPDVLFIVVLFVFLIIFNYGSILESNDFKISTLINPKFSNDEINEFFVLDKKFISFQGLKTPKSRTDFSTNFTLSIDDIEAFNLERTITIYAKGYYYILINLKEKEIEEIRIFITENFPQLIIDKSSIKKIESKYSKEQYRSYLAIGIGYIVFFTLLNIVKKYQKEDFYLFLIIGIAAISILAWYLFLKFTNKN